MLHDPKQRFLDRKALLNGVFVAWSTLFSFGTDSEKHFLLQSIYVTRDRVILKFEAKVQIYLEVLNICCEIQNSGRNVVRFLKINSYEISFWLVLFKNMRNIRLLGVW